MTFLDDFPGRSIWVDSMSAMPWPFPEGRISAKICGITDTDGMDAAISGGADFVGLVFFRRSPRAVTVAQAKDLAVHAADRVLRVGLFVDPDDAQLDAVCRSVSLDAIQFHGQESPERCALVETRTGLPVIKALAIAHQDAARVIPSYAEAATLLLFDAPAPKGASRPGGLGEVFDWSCLPGRINPERSMLAGGLNADNVRDAIAMSGIRAVDCSSGVERTPGIKDPLLIDRFLRSIA